jgi:stringent starvation protein B
MGSEAPEKMTEMLRLLDLGLVMVHLDPRRDGVQVPEHLAADPALRLNIAYGFNLPGLEVDEQGIYAVLSFGGQNFGCDIPWEAVFALTLPGQDQEGALWPDDLPEELDPVFESIRHMGGSPADPDPDVERAAAKAAFAVIDGGAPPAKNEAQPEQKPGDRPGPHLRLVKG